MPTLVLEIDNAPRSFAVNSGDVLGRDASADVRIDHPTIGRRQARFTETARGFEVQPLKAANPTRVNGARLDRPVKLTDGASVRFGHVAGWFFPGEVPRELAEGKKAKCAVCQWQVEPKQELKRCESCGAAYHFECWHDNHGCATYGCPAAGTAEAGAVDLLDLDPVEPLPRVPWDSVLLGANVLASLLGLLAFGIPALLTAVAAAIKLRGRPAALATSTGLLGTLAGLAMSWFWWLSGPGF